MKKNPHNREINPLHFNPSHVHVHHPHTTHSTCMQSSGEPLEVPGGGTVVHSGASGANDEGGECMDGMLSSVSLQSLICGLLYLGHGLWPPLQVSNINIMNT